MTKRNDKGEFEFSEGDPESGENQVLQRHGHLLSRAGRLIAAGDRQAAQVYIDEYLDRFIKESNR